MSKLKDKTGYGADNYKQIVEILEEAEKVRKDERNQELLMSYCLSDLYPLEERFDIWKRFCNKVESAWVIHKGDFGIIGEMVDNCFPYDYDKYREYDFECFLDWIEEANKDVEDFTYGWPSIMKIDLPTVDQFKEMLMKVNFGSFVMDW